jgi:hypothetical protein
VHEQVSEAGIEGFFFSPIPDEKYRGESHDLPEDKKGEEVAGKHHPQRTPHIQENGRLLTRILGMKGIKNG